MSEEMTAVLTTICIIEVLIVWVPCLSLVSRYWRRYRNARCLASVQRRERVAPTDQRQESCAQTSDDGSRAFGRAALR